MKSLREPNNDAWRGPDQRKRDTVLAAVKDATRRLRRWPAAILDSVCARRHWTDAGRDEETALGSNKETDQKDKCRGRRDTIRPQGVHRFRPCRKNPTQKRTIDVLPKPDNLKSYRQGR